MTVEWRDIRTNPITKEDGDVHGKVFQLLEDGRVGAYQWDSLLNMVAWFPIKDLPKFIPKPDPPEGWRYIVPGEAFDHRRKRWEASRKEWIDGSLPQYSPSDIYVVPIEPPATQYRAFKNAAEFEPYRDLWWRHKLQSLNDQNPPMAFNDSFHGRVSWKESLATKVFCGDLPFGVLE